MTFYSKNKASNTNLKFVVLRKVNKSNKYNNYLKTYTNLEIIIIRKLEQTKHWFHIRPNQTNIKSTSNLCKLIYWHL